MATIRPALRKSCDDPGQSLGVRLVRRFGCNLVSSSLRKGKLMQAATPSVQFTVTVTDTPDDEKNETPRSFFPW
ncbi:hypothetical protein [Pseudoflavonifractor sp. An85]|uniref:hypothetical protein n=1 Tax=Pseudoflavonifractor sp. An85 TaxID=1965661 RepID=UPI000B37DB77|nr:hypothetical protein [Pseudoflavonifractor sp. An85]OUN25800.1 hypothetical protein B5G37_03025 [Pseudoflavonifractor sp. An85]